MQPSDFVPHSDLVTAPGATPDRWMLVLHGILGSGANFRSFARRLAAACPAWGFVLVDLRAHGQSTAAPPPYTLRAAAEDLLRLGAALGKPVRGVLGHSFGGKVALALADITPTPLDQLWILDSLPGSRPDELASPRTAAVVRMLEAMPEVFASRERFVEIVEQQGHERTFAAWLAMNLRRDGDAFRLRIDMTKIRALFADYYNVDLWPIVERHPHVAALHFVVGGRSDVIAPPDRERLQSLAARDPATHLHVLPDAGHWVHIDDPEGLFAAVSSALCAPAASE